MGRRNPTEEGEGTVNITGKQIAMVAAAALIGAGSWASADCGKCDGGHKGKADAAAEKKVEVKAQTTCPIMGGKINKELYVDADGSRIYVCCGGCIAKIKEDPAKAIAKIKANGETPEALPKCKKCAAGTCDKKRCAKKQEAECGKCGHAKGSKECCK